MTKPIALLSDDPYIKLTIGSMLLDLNYTLTTDLQRAAVLITDQPQYLSRQIPTIYIYDQITPAINTHDQCLFCEKPTSIQEILHAIQNLQS